VDDFTVTEPAGTVSCPAGHTRSISKTRVATFGALCRDCPLRQRCTPSKTGRKIVLHERDDLLRHARAAGKTDPELREFYRTFRPIVERVISQIATSGGRRVTLRYRGTTKNNAWLTRRTAALNLRNTATAVSDLPAAHRLAWPAGPQLTIKERRDPGAPSRGCRAPSPGEQTAAVLR